MCRLVQWADKTKHCLNRTLKNTESQWGIQIYECNLSTGYLVFSLLWNLADKHGYVYNKFLTLLYEG